MALCRLAVTYWLYSTHISCRNITSVDQMTVYYIPEDSALQQHHCDNIKSAHVRKSTDNKTLCHIYSMTLKKKNPLQNLKTVTSIEKVYQTQSVFNFALQLLFKTFFTKNNTTWQIPPKVWEETHLSLVEASTVAIQISSKPCNVVMCVRLQFYCYHVPPTTPKIQMHRKKFKAKTRCERPIQHTNTLLVPHNSTPPSECIHVKSGNAISTMQCLLQAARSPVHCVCRHNGAGKINTRSPLVFKSVTNFTRTACAPFTQF